ncbi:MAG: DNA repair protein RadA [Gammaproteobacteria bacterium]|nr:DNA repair protein RadA [Gammaproteobacteria bacterium]MCY4323474.1 DNA repair protein RadA [Gammaproteobacteria bacterium]
MPAAKKAYVCEVCGAEHPKWQGQCAVCGEWNSLKEVRLGSVKGARGSARIGYAGSKAEVRKLSEVDISEAPRFASGIAEFDRVLGGGVVPGSVSLIGGDPGAGKSTLLLQVAVSLCREGRSVLYVTGEESLEQLAARAKRLELNADQLRVASEVVAERVASLIETLAAKLVIIDSVQVMRLESVEGTPGSVSQVREAAALFTALAKRSSTAFMLVGHVTKEGNLAGPKVLEHIIDCSMMLESPAGGRFRLLRGVKNRFGAVNELGVFAMTERGMRGVANPSAIFLQRSDTVSPGSLITVLWEGTRPILVEIQALVDDIQGSYPRRIALGLDPQRLSMQLAVLHRHGGVSLVAQDVFVNLVGGVRINETGADLALILAVLSSFRDKPLPSGLIAFGEVGLTGEVRAVANGQERLQEAAKQGFRAALLPQANMPRGSKSIGGMALHSVASLKDAIDRLAEV